MTAVAITSAVFYAVNMLLAGSTCRITVMTMASGAVISKRYGAMILSRGESGIPRNLVAAATVSLGFEQRSREIFGACPRREDVAADIGGVEFACAGRIVAVGIRTCQTCSIESWICPGNRVSSGQPEEDRC